MTITYGNLLQYSTASLKACFGEKCTSRSVTLPRKWQNGSNLSYRDLVTLSYRGKLVTLSYRGNLVTLSYRCNLVTLSYHAGNLVTLSYHGNLVTLSYHGNLVTLSYRAGNLVTLAYRRCAPS